MCFSVWTIVEFLVALVLIWGGFAIAGVLASFFAETFGPAGMKLLQILKIIVICIAVIWIIYLFAELIVCAMPLGRLR